MVSKKVTLVNPQGFHMRPADDFVNAVKKFSDCSSVRKVIATILPDVRNDRLCQRFRLVCK